MRKTISTILIFVFIIAVLFGVYYFFFADRKEGSSNTNLKTDKANNEKDEGAVKIIAVGDSLTAGYGLPLSDSYPMQLEKKLLENNYNVEVVNAGISGETTAGLLERIEFIKSQNPDMVLITIGGNDALRALPIENTEKNILAIISGLKQAVPSSKIFLMQVRAPLNAGIAYASKFNSIYEEVAKNEDVHLVPFVESKVFLNNTLMQEDRIHPNTAGYKFLIDEYIYKAIKKEL